MKRTVFVLLMFLCTLAPQTGLWANEADKLAATGYALLQESDSDSNKAIDAAIALAAALAKYEEQENWDKAQQVKAALFGPKNA